MSRARRALPNCSSLREQRTAGTANPIPGSSGACFHRAARHLKSGAQVCSLCATGKYQAGRSPARRRRRRRIGDRSLGDSYAWRRSMLQLPVRDVTRPQSVQCADGAPTVDAGAEFSLAFARPRRSEQGGCRPHLNRVRGHVWRDAVARGGGNCASLGGRRVQGHAQFHQPEQPCRERNLHRFDRIASARTAINVAMPIRVSWGWRCPLLSAVRRLPHRPDQPTGGADGGVIATGTAIYGPFDSGDIGYPARDLGLRSHE